MIHSRLKQVPADFGLGLVTYLWGQDWDLPTLISHCEEAEYYAVELRTTHAHGVEPALNQPQRSEVARRFENSPVQLIGIGSNERFDHKEPAALQRALEKTRQFIQLSHDVGGSGVKVKPDGFPKGVDREKTIEQIGRSLNTLAEFGEGLGQEIRLEVHGQCAPLPIIQKIMAIADHENVGVCWNSNEEDLAGAGIVANFEMVKERLAQTCHVREFNVGDYPYAQLLGLLAQAEYTGWVLLEARTKPNDRVAALKEQRRLFLDMVATIENG